MASGFAYPSDAKGSGDKFAEAALPDNSVLPRDHAPRRDSWFAVAAGALLLLASLANFLMHNHYPLLRLDVGILAATIIGIALIMASLYASQRRWGRSFLEALLIAIFADLNGLLLWQALASGAALGLLGWWLRKPLVKPLALFGAVVLATTLAGVGGRSEWLTTKITEVPKAPVAKAPSFAVLHLILDEQIGPEGLRSHVDGTRLRSDLQRFFLDRNFALYGRAYSEHTHTKNAIPAILNFGDRPARKQLPTTVVVGEASYFSELHQSGFRLHILQNGYAELCRHNPVTECASYDYSSLEPTIAVPLSTGERVKLISLKFIAVSKLAKFLVATANKGGRLFELLGAGWSPFEPNVLSRTSTVAALAAIDEWSTRLRKAKPGDVYFAHLLIPHYPHVVRADCSYLPWTGWQVRGSNYVADVIHRTYAEQSRCALKKVAELIQAFEATDAGRRGVVIVHGDHGSRLGRVDPVSNNAKFVRPDDIIIGHSTLFAVRGTRARAQYYEMPQPITTLLRDFVSQGFEVAPQPRISNRKGFVMSNTERHPQYRAALPPGW